MELATLLREEAEEAESIGNLFGAGRMRAAAALLEEALKALSDARDVLDDRSELMRTIDAILTKSQGEKIDG